VYFVKVFEPGTDRPKPSDLRDGRPPADICMPELAAYVGSDQWNTTFVAWAGTLPSPQAVKAGALWLTCTAVEIPPESAPGEVVRDGSLRGVLATPDGMDAFRLCDPGTGRFVLCTEPHVYEAVSVIGLGEHFTTPPSETQAADLLTPLCSDAVAAYVGAARDDVIATWGYTSAAQWSSTVPRATCYAATTKPVVGVLHGLGRGQLPLAG
jgi:hypothetical protein